MQVCRSRSSAGPARSGSLKHHMVRRAVGAIILGSLLSTSAHAVNQFDWSLSQIASFYDSPDYHGGGQEGQKGFGMASYTGGDVTFLQYGPTLQATLDGDIGYLEPLIGAGGGHIVGAVDGSARYIFDPSFNWSVSETYGQVSTNILEGSVENNATNVNLFSTGPQFTLPLSEDFNFQFGGTYRTVRYDTANFPDSESMGGTVALLHDLSQSTNISLQADYTDTRYDEDKTPVFTQTGESSEFVTENVYVRYRHEGQRTQTTLDVGEGQVLEDGLRHPDPMVRLTWIRQLAPHYALTVTGMQIHTDTPEEFRGDLIDQRLGANPAIPGDSILTEETVNAPLLMDSLGVGLGYKTDRTRTSIEFKSVRDRFIDASYQNDNHTDSTFTFEHKIQPRLDGEVRIEEQTHDYLGAHDNTTVLRLEASLGWYIHSNLLASFGYYSEHRAYTESNYDYRNNVIYFGIRYSPERYNVDMDQLPPNFSGLGRMQGPSALNQSAGGH